MVNGSLPLNDRPGRLVTGWFLLIAIVATPVVDVVGNEFMDNFEIEYALSRALIEDTLFDYADFHLNQMKQKFPSQRDGIIVLTARMYAADRKRTRALAELQKIGRDSSHYTDACLIRADFATDLETKTQAYTDYFSAVKAPQPVKSAVDEFVNAVTQYVNILERESKTAEALKILKKLEAMPKGFEIDPRMLTVMRAQAVLASADAATDEGKTPIGSHKAAVEKTLEELTELQWQLDYPASLSYYEAAHAHILLGNVKAALKIIKTGSEFMDDVEQMMVSERGAAGRLFSPLVGANYYIGLAYFAAARKYKKSDPEKMKTLLLRARQRFETVQSEYAGSQFETRAVSKLDTVTNVLENVGVEITRNNAAAQAAKLKAGTAKYREKDYQRSAELFLEAASYKLQSKVVPEALYFAVSSLYKQQRFLEAMAIADFMAEYHKHSSYTHDALYNLALTLWKASKEQPSEQKQIEVKEEAIDYFGRFARLAPRHQSASKAAFRVAEYQYKKGSDLNKQKQELVKAKRPQKEINDAIRASHEAYLAAAPLYEVLTENYSQTDQGVKAFYKLGWIYYICGEQEKSAEYFLDYCDKQVRPVEDRMNAKFYGAERLMRAGKVNDAIAHFNELKSWLKPGGDYDGFKKVAEFRQNIQGMIPWCYDTLANQQKERLTEFETQLAALTTPPAAGTDASSSDTDEPSNTATDRANDADADAPDDADTDGDMDAGTDGDGDDAMEPALTVEQLEAEIEAARAAYVKYQKEAQAYFEAYLNAFPKDTVQAPSIMAKLGAMHFEKEEFEKGAEWFEKLNKTYPNTDAGIQSRFLLGRAYCKIKRWDKANETFTALLPTLHEYPVANIGFIARSLWQRDSDGKPTMEPALDPMLVLKANELLIKLADEPKHPEHERLQKLEELSRFRITECMLAQGNLEQVIPVYDQMLQSAKVEEDGGESAYYFKILFGKSQAYRGLKQFDRALRSSEELLAHINAKKYPIYYHRGVCEAGEAMMSMDDEDNVRKSVARFMQIINFADRSVPGVNEWVERAYFLGASACALIGDTTKADELKRAYLKEFPAGDYRQQISALPEQKFSPQSGETASDAAPTN